MKQVVKYFDQYYKYCSNKNLASNTINAYQNDLNEYKNQFLDPKNLFAEQVTSKQIIEYSTWLSNKGDKINTVKRKLATLRAFYRFLENEEIISITPLYNIPYLTDQPKQHKLLTKIQLTQLYKSICSKDKSLLKDSMHKCLFELFYGMGLTTSQVVNLNLEHITDHHLIIDHESKNRNIPILGKQIKLSLTYYLTLRKQQSDANTKALFLNRRKKRLSEQSIRGWLSEICAQNKIPITGPRELRVQFAIDYLKETGNLYALSDYLGHADVSYTIKSLENATGGPLSYPMIANTNHLQSLIEMS